MKIVIDDNNNVYVQDSTPNAKQYYHDRFYFNPNNITMASGDIFDLLQGYTSSTNVFRIQMQKSGSTYQVRIGERNDAGAWTDSAWHNLASGWNGLEIDYQAAHNAGSFSLWIGGMLKATLSAIDNDGSKIDSVRLGAQGVDTGTRGTQPGCIV